MTCDQRHVTLSLEALAEEDPETNWAIIVVTPDGNCFYHCGAAFMIIMEPGRPDLHFYDALRHKCCDEMDKVPLHEHSPNAADDRTQLEVFQHQSLADEDDYEMLDIKGVTPPTEPKDGQSEADYLAEVAAYPAKCRENLAKVEAEYKACMSQGRNMGEFNHGIHIMGLALATRKIVKIYRYMNDKYTVPTADDIFAPKCNDGICNDGMVMRLFYNPDAKSPHYNVAIPLQYLATYKIPRGADGLKPKTSKTHNSKGEKRSQLELDEISSAKKARHGT
jgi:hypothetical protein